MHLVHDLAVPEHARDDGHYLPWQFEKWAKKAVTRNYIQSRTPIYFDPTHINDQNTLALIPIANLFDKNEYDGTNPSVTLQSNIGLSGYTNANFLSLDTMFTSENTGTPYPKAEHCFGFIDDSITYGPMENPRLYITNIQSSNGHPGEQIEHLAVQGFLYYYRNKYFPNISSSKIPISLDDLCYQDYAEKLIPRAIGYSAQLLSYFFRGKIEVTNPKLGFNPDSRTIDTIRLSVKNITEDDEQNIEEMTDGKVQVVVKYKTLLEGPDDDYLYRVAEANGLTSLPSDELIEFEVSLIDPLLINPLPIYITELQVFVVFRGKLGNEDDGIAVGFKDVIGIIFDENWENGLAGNYSWQHTAPDDPHNIPNGETINIIQNNMLLKENIRYADSGEPRFNDTSPDRLGKQVGEYPDGIPISQNTYIHFYMPEMSINEKPPAEPGYTNDFQTFEFRFNNGLMLQFSQPGQFWYQNDTTAYYTWDPTLICIDNVYSLFQRAGIAIPEPLYLKDIVIVQQLLNLDEPPMVEHIQHLELDFIRIVGDKLSSD